jgi:AraC-like DNA-binding protein
VCLLELPNRKYVDKGDRLHFRAHDTYSRFSTDTGFGIKDHRFQLAKRLLRRPSPSATQIAFAVGYASLSGFCTTFRRRVGCSPTEFREREED